MDRVALRLPVAFAAAVLLVATAALAASPFTAPAASPVTAPAPAASPVTVPASAPAPPPPSVPTPTAPPITVAPGITSGLTPIFAVTPAVLARITPIVARWAPALILCWWATRRRDWRALFLFGRPLESWIVDRSVASCADRTASEQRLFLAVIDHQVTPLLLSPLVQVIYVYRVRWAFR